MADVFDDEDDDREGDETVSTDASVLSVAMSAAGHDPKVAEKAAALLEEQTKLVRLQSA